jgi:hypothetical protein
LQIKSKIPFYNFNKQQLKKNSAIDLWEPSTDTCKHTFNATKWRSIQLIQHKKRLFNQANVKKGLKHFNLIKENATYKFVRCLFTKGDFLKIYKTLLSGISQIYKLVVYDQSFRIQERFNGYSPMLSYLTCASNMFNTSTLLMWIAQTLSQVFILKCFSANKFFKKKYKTKYSIKIVHINKKFRLSNALKRFSLFVETQKYHKLQARLFFAIGDVCFFYRKGEMYKRKLLTYRKAFSAFQKK